VKRVHKGIYVLYSERGNRVRGRRSNRLVERERWKRIDGESFSHEGRIVQRMGWPSLTGWWEWLKWLSVTFELKSKSERDCLFILSTLHSILKMSNMDFTPI